jgi:hypothetical protein
VQEAAAVSRINGAPHQGGIRASAITPSSDSSMIRTAATAGRHRVSERQRDSERGSRNRLTLWHSACHADSSRESSASVFSTEWIWPTTGRLN